MKRETAGSLVLNGFLLVIGIIYVTYTILNESEYLSKVSAEFPDTRHEESVSSSVLEVFTHTKARGYLTISSVLLSDSSKITFHSGGEMMTDEPIHSLIKADDFLVKNPNDDTLFVYRQIDGATMRYRFVLFGTK